MPQYEKIRKGKRPRDDAPGTKVKVPEKPGPHPGFEEEKKEKGPEEPKRPRKYMRRSRLL